MRTAATLKLQHMSEYLFEVFVHNLTFFGAPSEILKPILYVALSDFEPVQINPTSQFTSPAEAIQISAGKSCSFRSEASFPEDSSSVVPCLIVCTSGADLCEIFGGRAQLGLRMQHAQSESLCPIWQHRAQAVPLHSRVNGAQTAVEGAQLLDSHESWGYTSPPLQRRTEPRCANSPIICSAGEASRQTCHEGNFVAAWAQLSSHTHHSSGHAIDIKALHKHGTLLAPHREDGGSRSSYKPSAGSALKYCCCPCAQHGDCHNADIRSCAADVDFGPRLCSMRQPSREALEKESQAAQEGALPKNMQLEGRVTVNRAMLEALQEGLAKGLAEIAKLRQEVSKLQASLRPPDSPAPTRVQQGNPPGKDCSRSMLEATLESLTRSLAEIDKLRQEVVTLHVSSGSPDSHFCTPLQQRASPPVAMQQSDHTRDQPGQSEGKQPGDLHLPPPRLQHAEVFRPEQASQRMAGKLSRRAIKKQSSETSKAGRGVKARTYADAQPTGHPVFNWRTSLRAEKPAMGSGALQRAGKGAQQDMSTSGVRTPAREEHCRAKASANKLSAALSPAAEQPPRQERRSRDGAPQDRDKAGHEQMLQQQQQGEMDPPPASTPVADAQAVSGQGDVEQATSTSAPLSCKHLKGRYLPLYSVFDEDGVIAEDALAGKFLELCHTLQMIHPVPFDADGARQHV